jgi:beta-lactamase regulating signal transducer with metallopeptidase domain/tetratricopeptide (TPR) repeat protein
MKTIMEVLGESSVRAIIIALMTVCVLRVLRVKSPGICHHAWTGVLVAMLCLPLLSTWNHRIAIRVLPALSFPAAEKLSSLIAENWQAPIPDISTTDSAAQDAPLVPNRSMKSEITNHSTIHLNIYQIAGIVYLTGFFILAIRLLAGTLLSRRLTGGATRNGLIVYTTQCTVPMTVGLFRARVFLPSESKHWDAHKIDAVLTHEKEHLRRRDPLIEWFAVLNRSLYWFNPLAWWLCGKLSALAEQACDDAVLARGHDSHTYTEHLLDFARSVRNAGALIAFRGSSIHGSNLEQRIRRILNSRKTQTISPFRLAILATLCGIAIVVPSIFELARAQGTSLRAPVITAPAAEAQTTGQPNGSALSREYLKGSFLESTYLSSQEASELEDIVENNPDNLEAESRLLSYYYTHEFKEKDLRPKHEQRILWLIQNHPEAALLNQVHGHLLPKVHNHYADGERLWNDQLQKYPDSPKVISNACSFFETGNIDLAIQCYKRGKSIDPENTSEWDRKLGNSYNSKMAHSPAEQQLSWAKEALSAFESAYAEFKPKTFSYPDGSTRTVTVALPDAMKGLIMISMTKAALAAGDLDKASNYAHQMLETAGAPEKPFNEGDSIYQGNSILGLIAVRKGDLDSAEGYLLKAGETRGSLELSFMPDMSLAKDLLGHGRRKTVLAFLRECQKSSNSGQNYVSQWIQEMEAGKTPDFDQVRHEIEQQIQDIL